MSAAKKLKPKAKSASKTKAPSVKAKAKVAKALVEKAFDSVARTTIAHAAKTLVGATSSKLSADESIAVRRRRPKPKLHIREAVAADSPTLCGGSHSPIWNISGDRPLESVSPQKAKDATCGRCMRVARSRNLL